MKFTVTVEQVDDPDSDGLIWTARVAEYPHLELWADNACEAATDAICAAVDLRRGHSPRNAP